MTTPPQPPGGPPPGETPASNEPPLLGGMEPPPSPPPPPLPPEAGSDDAVTEPAPAVDPAETRPMPPAGSPPAPPPRTGRPTGPPPAGPSGGGGNRTLLFIVGGAVALAAIGIVLWLVLGGKEPGKGASPTPTGGGTLAPSPVPTTGGPTTPPTSIPPTTTPPTETTPPPPPPGEGVVIGGHTTVPQPEGWEVFGSNDDAVEMGDSSGDYFFAKIEHGVDPSGDAGAIVQNVAAQWFNESYSQVQKSDPQSFPPFGGIVSVSRLDYEGIFTSQAGANEVRGFILVAVRQDGELLISVVESTPPAAFETNEPIWSPVASGTLSSFAGA